MSNDRRDSIATRAVAAPALDITILIPAYNEAESLPELHARLTEVLTRMGRSYEILFVDDGSTDGTAALLAQLAARDCHVGALVFRRNAGKSAGLAAGFEAARGAYIVTMDADLQDDPEEVPNLVARVEHDVDVVSGWKFKRHDPLTKTLPSKIFNAVVSSSTGVHLHDMNCGLKAYKREVVKTVRVYGELHRFIPVLAAWEGFTIGEEKVQHHARKHGRSKFGAARFLNGFLDLIAVLFLTRGGASPLHFFGRIGTVCFGSGLAICTYFAGYWLTGHALRVRPMLILGLVLIMLAMQFVSLGLLGEMIARPQRKAGVALRARLGCAREDA